MAAQAELQIDLSKLLKDYINTDNRSGEKYTPKGDAKYIKLKITIKDESKFGNNVLVVQALPEGVEKGPILGNGKVYWTDGVISKAERDDAPKAAPSVAAEGDDDFPF